jgi:hypothetical protein
MSLDDLLAEYQEHAWVKLGFIRKLPNGKYRVVSRKGKNLGTYPSRSGAVKRLRQVEFFKHQADDGVNKEIDLSKEELSYSAIMRALKAHGDKVAMICFLQAFKKEFDLSIKKELQAPEKIALQKAILDLSKEYKIKLDKEQVKNAAVVELGNADQVGKNLADIIRWSLNKIPIEKRPTFLDKIKKKLWGLNENEIAAKEMPMNSAIGQGITFVKHVLFNQSPGYVRQVLRAIVGNLQ